MSSTLSKEVSKETDGFASASKADDKTILQACKPLIQLAVFTGCGVACGFAFEKARGDLAPGRLLFRLLMCCCFFVVLDPAVIQDQMEFARFVMLKMFLSAVSTGKLFSINGYSIITSCIQLSLFYRTCELFSVVSDPCYQKEICYGEAIIFSTFKK